MSGTRTIRSNKTFLIFLWLFICCYLSLVSNYKTMTLLRASLGYCFVYGGIYDCFTSSGMWKSARSVERRRYQVQRFLRDFAIKRPLTGQHPWSNNTSLSRDLFLLTVYFRFWTGFIYLIPNEFLLDFTFILSHFPQFFMTHWNNIKQTE